MPEFELYQEKYFVKDLSEKVKKKKQNNYQCDRIFQIILTTTEFLNNCLKCGQHQMAERIWAVDKLTEDVI